MMKQGEVPTWHNEVRKKMISTEDNRIDERCDVMGKGMKAGNSKEAYEALSLPRFRLSGVRCCPQLFHRLI